ncbi:MAG: acyltransferase [Firmicutes bacterium]|nr:acyltransferase [Bacillota bacterium]
MRKHYLDNIKWITVVLVVIYHVIYMYNAEGVAGVVGKITNLDVQYYDIYQYIVYPWFMCLLFIVSGVSSRLYLDSHSDREFFKSRTTKLLVPSTIGVVVFQILQGYINVGLSEVFLKSPELPSIAKYFIMLFSGIGVLWYIQVLWIFSLVLLLIRKIEKGRLVEAARGASEKAGLPLLLILAVVAFGAAQILNTPVIAVYRFGLYLFMFLLGYFFLASEEAVDVVKRWFPLFLAVALAFGTAFCITYFGANYADKPANRSVLFVGYAYFASLAVFGGMAKYGDFSNSFTQWMTKRSFGLYVFHYMGLSAVGLFLAKPGLISAPAAYLLSLIGGFGGAYLLNAVISRLPFFRWAVLGIRKEKKA